MKSESGTLEMNVSSTQQQWLSDIVSKPIELEVYSENFLVSAFSLDGSMLKTALFPPFCEFSMTNKSSNRMTATLAVEIVQPSRSNPSTTRKNENLFQSPLLILHFLCLISRCLSLYPKRVIPYIVTISNSFPFP